MKPPVFIVGCPRSGTSFLYHLLLSAGGFAAFHTQMNVFDVLEPIYGDLGSAKNKTKMMREWLQSKAFQASGLQAREIEARIMQECGGASDFLRLVMEEVARQQNVDRWIDSTPTNIPHMLRIRRDFPDALFLHIIRDPRDVALSLDKRGWSRPLPWQKDKSLLAAGLYWEWIVRLGRANGRELGACYHEVRYEQLLERPREILPELGQFLRHDLDYDRIQRTRVGSIKTPLTSFEEDLKEGRFTPVGRWRDRFPSQQLAQFEDLIGDYMGELGYPRATSPSGNRAFEVGKTRFVYRHFYQLKQWAKVHTPLSRMMVSYSDILFDK